MSTLSQIYVLGTRSLVKKRDMVLELIVQSSLKETINAQVNI